MFVVVDDRRCDCMTELYVVELYVVLYEVLLLVTSSFIKIDMVILTRAGSVIS